MKLFISGLILGLSVSASVVYTMGNRDARIWTVSLLPGIRNLECHVGYSIDPQVEIQTFWYSGKQRAVYSHRCFDPKSEKPAVRYWGIIGEIK